MTTIDSDTQQSMTTPQGRNLTAKTLVGDYIQNPHGEKLGMVEDLMLDLESGRVAYVVVSYGTLSNLKDKLFAVPWKAFRLDTQKHRFILDVDETVLKNAEGFDQDNWPNTVDRDWESQLHQHYGVRPYWEDYH